MPSDADGSVSWEVLLDKEYVRQYLNTRYKGWSGYDAHLSNIMWAIFEYSQDRLNDEAKDIAKQFLFMYNSELGLPEPSDD